MYFKMGKKLAIVLLVIVVIICIVGVFVIITDGSEWSDDEIEMMVEEMEEEELSVEEPTEAIQDEFIIALNPERDYLMVVNGWHPYEFGSEYDMALKDDLIYVADSYGTPTLVEKAAYLAFSMMKAELWNEHGISISLYSAYRTYDDQAWVYENYGEEGKNEVAEPLFSEHHTGLLIDFRVWQHGAEWHKETLADQLNDCFYEAIRGKLSKYGFIERYPLGKEDITGISCQPSEIRFVGSSEIAQEIMDNDWCLEEYRMMHG